MGEELMFTKYLRCNTLMAVWTVGLGTAIGVRPDEDEIRTRHN
jgi:hypothetical protein